MIKTKELEIDVARCEAYIYRVIKGQVKILKIDGKAIGMTTEVDYKLLLSRIDNCLKLEDDMFLMLLENL